jgi:hypothetical protein
MLGGPALGATPRTPYLEVILFLVVAITFAMTASDVGSDDLTFEIDFGDGETFTATAFNDGIGPDPYPSPEVNPITATATATHAYGGAGTYAVTATVWDDDGGVALLLIAMVTP